MTNTPMLSVLERSMEDPAFVEQFETDPEAALAEYDLSETEEEALLSRDGNKIREVLDEASFNIAINFIWVS